MPQDITKEEVNLGQVIYQWSVKEYEQYERDGRWYWMMGIPGAALLVYAILAANYLFALVVVLFAIILFMHGIAEPVQVDFAITNTGLVLGRKYYKYNELSDFWIIYTPPEVKNLYFSVRTLTKHRLQISLLDNDPRPIRDYLKQYLVEDLEQEEEPLSDKIGRLFKLH
ncbi:MAG: hypothetical protein AAB678_03450 [Patescibacteria group bacterium]